MLRSVENDETGRDWHNYHHNYERILSHQFLLIINSVSCVCRLSNVFHAVWCVWSRWTVAVIMFDTFDTTSMDTRITNPESWNNFGQNIYWYHPPCCFRLKVNKRSFPFTGKCIFLQNTGFHSSVPHQNINSVVGDLNWIIMTIYTVHVVVAVESISLRRYFQIKKNPV